MIDMEVFTGLLWSVIGFGAGYLAGRDARQMSPPPDRKGRR